MIILRCLICDGEIEILKSHDNINKKVKCNHCGFSNEPREPEVFVIRKKKYSE